MLSCTPPCRLRQGCTVLFQSLLARILSVIIISFGLCGYTMPLDSIFGDSDFVCRGNGSPIIIAVCDMTQNVDSAANCTGSQVCCFFVLPSPKCIAENYSALELLRIKNKA